MIEGLPNRMRPTKLSEVIGQDSAVKTLKAMASAGFPSRFLMFTGPSGCGKTTLARIVKDRMGCVGDDFTEINAAQERGIDLVRSIEAHAGYNPICGGKCRVWLIDEAHQLTADAQGGFLKLLEEPPGSAYFMFATTDPQKIKPTIRTRATVIELKAVGVKDLQEVVARALESMQGPYVDENGDEVMPPDVSDEVVERIAESAQGSPRKALVLLEQVMGIDGEEGQIAALEAGVPGKDAIEIARLLVRPGASWSDMAKVLKGIEGLDEQAESIRWLVLSFMSTVALGGGKQVGRACEVIEAFRDNFYESKRAGLIKACHDCIG